MKTDFGKMPTPEVMNRHGNSTPMDDYDYENFGIRHGSKEWDEAVELAQETVKKKLQQLGLDFSRSVDETVLAIMEMDDRGEIACQRRLAHVFIGQIRSIIESFNRRYWPGLNKYQMVGV